MIVRGRQRDEPGERRSLKLCHQLVAMGALVLLFVRLANAAGSCRRATIIRSDRTAGQRDGKQS